ncbi:LacI family DNA-binding transcriptional regulator [Pengzhenrongella sp.]|uniref:LacI family DNA-binding transcriptional regulator n=1 Tax=Pengzhenrongella sp. TaxID=2888820 RepID=UPI002F93C989
MGKNDVSLQQVALHAGVSIATVSRVARGIGPVSDGTRALVKAAIEELGFHPSRLDRPLLPRTHGALGVVLPGFSGPYHSGVIAGFEAAAVASRLSVMILGTHLLAESNDLVLDMADRVDGIAVLGGSVDNGVIDALVRHRCPVVQVAGLPRKGVPTVRCESTESVRALTRHLLVDHGFERLAFVGNPVGSPDAAARWLGFRAAHRDAGRIVPNNPIRVGHDQGGGMLAAEHLLKMRNRPRGVVCINDENALGVLIAVLGNGLRVPDDIAITGFDDLSTSALTSPPLTTVRQPVRELGARTLETLLTLINAGPEPVADLVLPTEVVLRSSCGCPPAQPRPIRLVRSRAV